MKRRRLLSFWGVLLPLAANCSPSSSSSWVPVARTSTEPVGRLIVVGPGGDDAASGARTAPLRTISAAAERAQAGDEVRILPGTYAETVRIPGEGRPGRPIVFAAETASTVIITGEESGFAPLDWAGDDDRDLKSGNRWVTLRGLVFRDIGDRPAVRASTGWRVEGSLFERLSIGVNIRGDQVVVTDSIFQDIDSTRAHAIVAVGGRDVRLSDLIIRRINRKRLIKSITHSAVFKTLRTRGLVIERIVSRDNIGPGLWLDTDNRDFVIRNSYLSGNAGDRYEWEGPGLWIENNPSANGQIYDNVITDNSGSGIEIMESSGVVVRDNTLVGNSLCIAFRNLERGPDNPGIADIRILGNRCADWTEAGIATGIGEWNGWDAQSRQVVIDGNLYRQSPGKGPIFDWLGSRPTTLDEARATLRLEMNGAGY